MSFQTNWVESSTLYSAAHPASLSELSANKTTSKIDKCLWICECVCECKCVCMCAECINESVSESDPNTKPNLEPAHTVKAQQIK